MASYGLLKMGDNNRIDISQTEYITAEGPPELDVEQTPVEGNRAGDGVLTFGTLLPQTGSLAFLGPPEFAGFDLAIQEINENGGVLGADVVGIEGDSGDTTTDQANQTVDRLLSENVDVIIGAASSGVTLSVIDKITAAGVTMFSPANTSEALSTYADKGLYFRTAPPDLYQGDVLGQFVVNDGNQTVAILNLNDAYGNGLGRDGRCDDHRVRWRSRVPAVRTTRPRRRSTARSTPSSPPTPTRSSSSASTSRRRSSGPWSKRASARRTRPSTAPTATSATPSALTSTPATDRRPEPRTPEHLNNEGARATRPGLLRVVSGASVAGEGAEVELDHLGVGEQLAPGARVGVRALVEHVAAVAHLQRAAGVLLDHQDGHARRR